MIGDLLKKIKKLSLPIKYKSKINLYLKDKIFKNNKEYVKIVSNLPSPSFENSLEGKYPLISKEWDYKKNFPLKPSMFKSGSNADIWWICKKNNHSYMQKLPIDLNWEEVVHIVQEDATKSKNLKVTHPNLIKEWNFKLNKDKKPENFTPISGQFIWWNCEHGHI